MTHTLLVTTGNGMFGRALVNALAGDGDVNVRALVRNESAFNVSAPNVSSIVGDMDKPETLVAAVDGVDLVSPQQPPIASVPGTGPPRRPVRVLYGVWRN